MRTLKSEKFDLLLHFIEQYREDNEISPTMDEVADGVGMPKTTVHRYLNVMKEHGMVSYEGKRDLLPTGKQNKKEPMLSVPVLGNVACGVPKFAEENIEEWISLPESLFGKGKFFLLRAEGNSMIKAGIFPGDLVLIRQQNQAETGQIVVALVEDEATLKRYYPEKEKIRLQPENDAMEPIFVKNCLIQGVAVKVIRDLE